VYFVVVLIVEIAAIPMIYRRPSVGGVLGILAAIPNILFILADLMPSTSNLLPEAICLWNIKEIKSEIGKFLAEHPAMESQIL
jgi:hypothetical protein